MKKYLTFAAIIFIVACSKKHNSDESISGPQVLNFHAVSDNSTGVIRPRLIFTLNMPDTSISILYLNRKNQNDIYPIHAIATIKRPTSIDYSILDSSAVYPPPTPYAYTFSFWIKDSTYTGIKVFEVK